MCLSSVGRYRHVETCEVKRVYLSGVQMNVPRPADASGTYPSEHTVPDPDSVSHVLIRSVNWLGDLVMQTPLLRAARQLFSEAHITLLVRDGFQSLAARFPWVDECMYFEKRGGFRETLEDLRISRQLRNRREEVALVVPNSIRAALAPALAGISCRTGYREGRSGLLTHAIDPASARLGTHRVYRFLGVLDPWRKENFDPAPSLPVNDEIRESARSLIEEKRQEDRVFDDLSRRRIIALNPGATYGTAKRWLPSRYVRLARKFTGTEKGGVLVLGSPAERSLGRRIASSAGPGTVSIAGRTALDDLTGILSLSDLLVTNDTGTMHVSDAVRTPVVALFGSTDPSTTAPYRDMHTYIREPVFCSPCELRHCPIDHRCMKRISVLRVWYNLQEYL